MIRTGWLAALVVALAPWPCPAQFGGMGGMGMGGRGMGMGGRGGPAQPEEEWTVKFETFDGQSVTGKLRLASVAVECSLGLYEIKPGKIKEVQLNPTKEPLIAFPGGTYRDGAVVTESGEKVVGKVNVPYWRVETELGTLTPGAQHLKTLTFVARSEAAKTTAEAKPNPASKPSPSPPASGSDKPGEPPPVADPVKGPARPGEPEKKP